MSKYLFLLAASLVVLFCAGTLHAKGKDARMNEDAKVLIEDYLVKYKPLDKGQREAWYKYNTTGDKKESERESALVLETRKLNSDKERFKKLSVLYKDRGGISDPLIKRQIELLYLWHLPNQITADKLEKLTKLEKRLEEGFNDYQPVVDGKKLLPVDIEHILSESTDSALLEKVWKAKYLVAPSLENDYRELVKLRNEIARDLGYKSALELEAATDEMDMGMLDRFYADVAKATDKPFKKLKEEYIDPRLAKRYGIKAGDLKPWHYQNAYFQEAPTAIFGKVNLDDFYKKTDGNKAIAMVEDFYGSMGIDVKGIIGRSSLFPKPGKNPHAFANLLDPDKPGSSVLLMNLPKPPGAVTEYDVSTLIHELGHDVNYEAILVNKYLPYLLREPTMLTEAVAMLFEHQITREDWFKRIGIPEDRAKEAAEAVDIMDYVDQLIFLRWSSNIYCFEKGFYGDPDRDIGDLWWECREKNQLLPRPEGWKNPDALAKIHIPTVSPLYYSNYAIGRVANVQFADLVAEKIGADPRKASYYGRSGLGAWMMADFLAQGERYRWDEFIKMSIGKPLSVDAWKKFYIGSEAEKKLYAQ